MSQLRAHNIAVSLDGFMAGPDQSLEHPLGVGGPRLHEWVFATRTGAEMVGGTGGDTGIDDDFLARGTEGIGATIIGRNMFGPVRGPWESWPGEAWNGWWGDDPPYHHPVFVLTHHPRAPVTMDGDTTFHFVTDGIESALRQATEAAGGEDVRVGGGAATIQAYLRADLLDALHLAIVPVLLGSGERLFDHLEDAADRLTVDEVVTSPTVTHVQLVRPT
ncbi:dihydrofolate reductase family protein [Acidothermaceae bacterium B102]|nr:dihydrofolate reductase family protein [Acidothermaceae bacterium B102]